MQMTNNERPVVAWICNSLPPYRLYSFRRIIREIPEIEFWSLFTHGPGKSNANLPWKQEYPADIRPITFHSGEPLARRLSFRTAISEWNKGGRMIRWLKQHHSRAVIVGGYNDLEGLELFVGAVVTEFLVFLLPIATSMEIVVADGKRLPKADSETNPPKLFRSFGLRFSGCQILSKIWVRHDRIYIAPYESDFELFQRRDAERIIRSSSNLDLLRVVGVWFTAEDLCLLSESIC